MLKNGPSKSFLGGMCICLAVALLSILIAPYKPPQTPTVESKQQSEQGAKRQQNGEHAESSEAARGDHGAGDGSNEAPEFWTILGMRVRPTDTLLVIFTFMLWWSTNKLWLAGEKQLVVTGRAYVFMRGPRSTPLVDNSRRLTGIRIVAEFENVGNTPTKNMSSFINGQMFAGALSEPPVDFEYPYQGDRNTTDSEKGFIGPRTTIPKGFVDLPMNAVKQIAGRKDTYFIWGRVEYWDVFDGTPKHNVEFCFRILIDGDFSVPDRHSVTAMGVGTYNRYYDS